MNLERALAVGDRLGGHFVAGHVDGIARIVGQVASGEARRWTVEVPMGVHRFVAEKGSVALDGVSLTVNSVGPTTLDVMLVPFTLAATTFGARR